MKSLRPAPVRRFRNMTTGQKIETLVFRVIVGIIGLIVLAVGIKYRLYAQDLRTFFALAAFCGLLLGYAFAGDKWGARLAYLFSGHRVHVEEEPEIPGPAPSDDGSSARHNVQSDAPH